MPDRGILILGEPWTPGWTAEVDRLPSEVLRVDGALRGVYLTGGDHNVIFRFNPPRLTTGLTISIITVIVGLVAGITGMMANRKRNNSGN